MAYKIRIINKKQELKRPDEFISTMDRLSESVRVRARTVLLVAGLIFAAAAGFGGWIWFQAQQEEIAAEVAFRAAAFYHDAGAPSAEEGDTKPTREENLEKSIELYRQVVTHYPRTRSAFLSRYYLGNAFLELGKYDEAISEYQVFVERHPDSPMFIGLAYQRQGYSYLSKGEKEAAQVSFENSLATEQTLNKDQVLFELGRLHERQGKKEDAVGKYQTLIGDHPDSLLAHEARVRLRGLGVTMTEPAAVEDSSGQSSSTENPPPVESLGEPE